ncbi:hypothetical protein EYF80_031780 [Liparis tanakae]|uniref:Uncharacterized protein n=1 Tax=Liparis tanakae TaxID=230148 RepID=A0A4Z2GZF2_9TELE|nr:hypothetical protein EYF80_031780 [Liparis tanakae]
MVPISAVTTETMVTPVLTTICRANSSWNCCETENRKTSVRMLLISASSAEVCGAGMSGLLLLRILDWRSIEPTVAAVPRPMVL